MAVDLSARTSGDARTPGYRPPPLYRRRTRTQSDRFAEWFFVAVTIVMPGYLLFDRAFAWIHVPGTPIFVGEITLLLGILATGFSKRTRALVKESDTLQLLLVFVAWGLLRTIPDIPSDPINVIRDAALWYYALFAVVFGLVVMERGHMLARFLSGYPKILWLFFLWAPAALAIPWLFDFNINVPDSAVSIFAHKPGNVGSHAGLAVAFVWLVPTARNRLNPQLRTAVTALGLLVLMITGTQNRGGLLAGGAAVGVAVLFTRFKKSSLSVGVLIAMIVVVATIAFNISLPLKAGRELSAAQIVTNVLSIVGADTSDELGSNLNNTTEWRTTFWTMIIEDTFEGPTAFYGQGFGLNFAEEYGFIDPANAIPLRNPHNSHIHVFARMGLIGLTLWFVLWGVWYRRVWTAYQTHVRRGHDIEAGLAMWAVAGVTAFLVSAFFDPTLEGAQISFWLWGLFGLGAVLASPSALNRLRPARSRTEGAG